MKIWTVWQLVFLVVAALSCRLAGEDERAFRLAQAAFLSANALDHYSTVVVRSDREQHGQVFRESNPFGALGQDPTSARFFAVKWGVPAALIVVQELTKRDRRVRKLWIVGNLAGAGTLTAISILNLNAKR